MTHNIYRDDRVHVCAEMCPTCIFRPGNLMTLRPGRLRDMVKDAQRDEAGTIVCHETLEAWDGVGDRNAVCRGFFDRFRTAPLQIAERLDLIQYITPRPRREP